MKRIFIMLSSLILLSVSAFAEVTFSGEFAYGFNSSDEDYASTFDTGDINVTGTSGAATAFIGLDTTVIGSNFDGTQDKQLSSDFIGDAYVSLDVIQGLGMDSPVGVSLLIGKTSFSAQNYLGDVAGFQPYDTINAETATSAYSALTIDVMDLFTIVYALDPNVVDDVQNTYVNVYSSIGIVNAEAYYNFISDEYRESYDDFENCYEAFGGDFSVSLVSFVPSLEELNVGAGLEYNDTDESISYGSSVGVGISGLYCGLAFTGITSDNDNDDDDLNGLGVDASYEITDALKIYGAYKMDDLSDISDDTTGFEVSASYSFLETTTLYLGYVTEGADYNALSSDNDSVFLAISTSF